MEFIIFFIDWTCKTVGQRQLRVFIMYTYLPDHPRQTLRRVFK